VYGKCANPAGHGPNYRFEVAIEGDIDPVTGRILAEERLDDIVRSRLLSGLDGHFLNRDVPAFRAKVPTAENIARYIWDTLVSDLAPARLVGVRLIETRNNSVEYDGVEEFV
jgi:6-pyruvoyltetrahydropterin/6-carboxytetrahydropterin synthase